MAVQLHFLNVGAGDCTIIHFPKRESSNRKKEERIMMVDINHDPENSNYQNVIDYYKETLSKHSEAKK